MSPPPARNCQEIHTHSALMEVLQDSVMNGDTTILQPATFDSPFPHVLPCTTPPSCLVLILRHLTRTLLVFHAPPMKVHVHHMYMCQKIKGLRESTCQYRSLYIATKNKAITMVTGFPLYFKNNQAITMVTGFPWCFKNKTITMVTGFPWCFKNKPSPW